MSKNTKKESKTVKDQHKSKTGWFKRLKNRFKKKPKEEQESKTVKDNNKSKTGWFTRFKNRFKKKPEETKQEEPEQDEQTTKQEELEQEEQTTKQEEPEHKPTSTSQPFNSAQMEALRRLQLETLKEYDLIEEIKPPQPQKKNLSVFLAGLFIFFVWFFVKLPYHIKMYQEFTEVNQRTAETPHLINVWKQDKYEQAQKWWIEIKDWLSLGNKKERITNTLRDRYKFEKTKSLWNKIYLGFKRGVKLIPKVIRRAWDIVWEILIDLWDAVKYGYRCFTMSREAHIKEKENTFDNVDDFTKNLIKKIILLEASVKRYEQEGELITNISDEETKEKAELEYFINKKKLKKRKKQLSRYYPEIKNLLITHKEENELKEDKNKLEAKIVDLENENQALKASLTNRPANQPIDLKIKLKQILTEQYLNKLKTNKEERKPPQKSLFTKLENFIEHKTVKDPESFLWLKKVFVSSTMTIKKPVWSLLDTLKKRWERLQRRLEKGPDQDWDDLPEIGIPIASTMLGIINPIVESDNVFSALGEVAKLPVKGIGKAISYIASQTDTGKKINEGIFYLNCFLEFCGGGGSTFWSFGLIIVVLVVGGFFLPPLQAITQLITKTIHDVLHILLDGLKYLLHFIKNMIVIPCQQFLKPLYKFLFIMIRYTFYGGYKVIYFLLKMSWKIICFIIKHIIMFLIIKFLILIRVITVNEDENIIPTMIIKEQLGKEDTD